MNDNKSIIIYTTPTCPYCQQAKMYLTDKGVPFIEKDVATDLQAREEMVRKSGQLGVPVIEVDGDIIIGFNRSRLEDILAI